MKQKKFSITHPDEELRELINIMDRNILAIWSIDCTQRVMHLFEDSFPNDPRPRQALVTLQNWIQTGEFHMAKIRKASLDSHAAAREVGEDSPARSVARAAGQAVATAHVHRHAYGSAIYAQQAIFRATNSFDASIVERNWQCNHLLVLKNKSEGI